MEPLQQGPLNRAGRRREEKWKRGKAFREKKARALHSQMKDKFSYKATTN